MDYPEETGYNSLDSQFMFGSSFLVGLTYPDINKCNITFPAAEDFYDFNSGKIIPFSVDPLEIELETKQVCAFVKAGSIIPRKMKKRFSSL